MKPRGCSTVLQITRNPPPPPPPPHLSLSFSFSTFGNRSTSLADRWEKDKDRFSRDSNSRNDFLVRFRLILRRPIVFAGAKTLHAPTSTLLVPRTLLKSRLEDENASLRFRPRDEFYMPCTVSIRISLSLSISRARATGSDSRTSARSLQEGEVEDGRKSRIPCSRREDSRNTRRFAKTSRDAIPWFRGRRGSSRTSRKWDRCLVNYCFLVEFSRFGMHSLFC